MNLLRLFQRPNPGRELASIGHRQRKQQVRDLCDQMRRDLGLPPVKWPRLG